MALNRQKNGNAGRRRWRRLWLLRRRKKILRCKQRRERRHDSNTGVMSGLTVNQHTRGSVSVTPDRKLIIELPERLDFEENYEETTNHFALLRKAVRERKTIRSLRFNKIKFISPSAALVLASEVDLWNSKVGGKLKADVGSWSEDIRRLLCQMGYFELLNIRKPDETLPQKGTTFLPFTRGRIGKIDPGQLAKQLRIEIEKLVGPLENKNFLFDGLSEAMTNVGQHAYPDASEYALHQWWLSASYDSDEKALSVAFFDQGAGIPTTLPRAHFIEFITGFSVLWPDSRKIEAAMETGRTSTGKMERGKGLQNLVEFAKSHREGQLSIYSLNGMYRQRYSLKQALETIKRDHKTSIGGTLIEWSVKL